MNTEKNKNLTPARNVFQVKTAPTTVSSTTTKSPKRRNPFMTALFVLVLLLAAVGAWLLFAINRPGIEIHSGATLTPGPSVSAQAQAVAPGQTMASTQPAISASPAPTPGPTKANPQTAGTTTNATAPTPTLIVVNNQSRPQIQGYGVVTSKILNLRSAPNTDAPVIKSLKTGDIVELINRSGGWYQTSEGLWISASYMEVRQTRPEAESYARELASS